MLEVYLYDGEVLRIKGRCEERDDGKCVATVFEVEIGCEEHEEFETYSAARAKMYEMLLEKSLQYSNLTLRGKINGRIA